jgi:hypothetical protein
MRNELRRGTKAYSKYVDEAKGEEREFRIHEAMDARGEKRDSILNLSSMLLTDKAERLGVPIPPFSDKESWEEGYWPDSIRLNVKAQADLRQLIRAERREKWGFSAFLLKDILTPLIGVIGAIMGLVSLIHALKAK